MRFVSTRGGRGGPAVTLDEAISRGIARDGGLFVPEALPQFSPDDFAAAATIGEVGAVLMRPFLAGSRIADEVGGVLDETFGFPVPLRDLGTDDGTLRLLELFHGPTAAFKDVGAGFLAACLGRLESGGAPPLTILVATSGDTGSAVAAAFDGRSGMQVAILHPEGRVSERQARQLGCWGDNVLSLAVRGTFDDCQALVKAAMADRTLSQAYRLGSANSINAGRLLPQCIYYAWAGLEHRRKTGRTPGFIVPTGNLGNALACLLARAMGLPIGDVVLATNANRVVVDWLEGGDWTPRASVQTLASAMDVGNPSNMERLLHVFGGRAALAGTVTGRSADDGEIAAEIRRTHDAFGVAVCPHTATALHAWRRLPDDTRSRGDWIAVATAHPAKFERIVEPLIGATVPLPRALRMLLGRPASHVPVEPSLDAVAAAMAERFRLDAVSPSSDK